MESDEDSSNDHRIGYLKKKKNLIWNYLTLLSQPKKLINNFTKELTFTKTANVALGTCLIAFAIYNIHIPANITDGGGLGLILLLNHWFNIPPFIVAPVIDILLYIIAVRFLGIKFLRISILSTIFLTLFLRVFASLPTLFLDLSGQPLIAALMGGVFIGVGAGLVFRQGGSCGGDDALVITISKLSKWRISMVYVLVDSTILLLSMTYIAPSRIIFSLITAVTSSIVLDLTCSLWRKKRVTEEEKRVSVPLSKPLVAEK